MRLPPFRRSNRVPRVDRRLEIEPELRRSPERLGETGGKRRLDPLVTVENLTHMLATYIEGRCQFANTNAARLDVMRP